MDTVIELSPPNTNEAWSIRSLLSRSFRPLLEPTRFFRTEFPQMSFTEALTFGISNAWVAAVLAFFVQTFNSLVLSQLLDRWMQRLVASEEGFAVWGLSAKSFLVTAGLLLLAPFFLLLRTYVQGGLLYLFSRLLIEDHSSAPERVTYQGTVKIQAATLVARWFMLVPIFGWIISFIAGLVLSVAGVRERFGVSNRRAMAVVLAPYILLCIAIFFLVLIAIFAFSQLPLEELLDIDELSGLLGN